MNQPDIGEQAISKAAEVGIESQLDEADNLDVDIRANPLDLAGGEVESATIDGKGMVMKQDLRAERLVIQTDKIAINSMKAAFGNIELEETTNAEAKVVLLEEDIQRAFNSEYVEERLKNQQIEIDGETLTVNASNVKFTLSGDNKISLSAQVYIEESQETKEISLSAKPTLEANGNKIAITDAEYHNDENIAFAKALLETTGELLDLRNFEPDSMSYKLNKLDVGQGKIIMAADAVIHEFPDS